MNEIIVTYPNVESSMKAWRKIGNQSPVSPKSTVEIFHQLEDEAIREKFGKCDGENFIHFVPKSCERAGQSILLMRESMLDKIDKGNAKCFCDGTFNFFPEFFKQLFILQFLIGKFVSF